MMVDPWPGLGCHMHIANGKRINSRRNGPEGTNAHTGNGRCKELHVSLDILETMIAGKWTKIMGKIKKKNRSGQLITHDIAILSFLNFGNFFDVMDVSTFIFWRYQENPFGPWQSKTKEKIWKNYSWMVQVQGRIPCKSYISIYIYKLWMAVVKKTGLWTSWIN